MKGGHCLSLQRITRPLCLVCLGLQAATGTAFGLSASGVEEVLNAASPRRGRQTITAVELWRAGGDGERLFGAITRVITGPMGSIYILDGQLAEVQVFSAAGEYERTLSREGDGPGEVRHPTDICFLPDAALGIVQPFPGKVIKVELDGDPAGALTFGSGEAGAGGFAVLLRALMRGGTFVLGGMRITYANDGSGSETRFFARADGQGREEHTYLSRVTQVNYGDFALTELGQDFAWERCALGPAGCVYLAPQRNAYRIEIHNPAGELERVVCREYESLKRTNEQLRAARARLEAYARRFPTPPRQIAVEETEPDISALWVAADGRLWVRTSVGDSRSAPGILTTFDLFDPDGRFERQVALACPGDPARDLIFLLDQGRLILVVGGVGAVAAQQGVVSSEVADDAAEELEVICYRLVY